jgi:hypothetical protein
LVAHLADSLNNLPYQCGIRDVLVGFVKDDELIELSALVACLGKDPQHDDEKTQSFVLFYPLVTQINNDRSARSQQIRQPSRIVYVGGGEI